MDPWDSGPTDEAKGKDGGHSLSLLLPRFFSEHQLKYTSWQNIALAMLAALEAGKRRVAGRKGKKMRNGFGEERWTQEMVLVDTFSSVAQSCPTLCDTMNCSTPGLPVHHHLPEFTQTHVHRAGDAIQPSHTLSSPFPPASNPSQHQSLFQ